MRKTAAPISRGRMLVVAALEIIAILPEFEVSTGAAACAAAI